MATPVYVCTLRDCDSHECIYCGNLRSHERAVAEGPCNCDDALMARVLARGDDDGFQTVAGYLWTQL